MIRTVIVPHIDTSIIRPAAYHWLPYCSKTEPAYLSELNVSVGDFVEKNQTIGLLDFSKPVADIASPYTGYISRIFKVESDIVYHGETLLEIESEFNHSDLYTKSFHRYEFDLFSDYSTILDRFSEEQKCVNAFQKSNRLNNLALVYSEAGEFEKAESLFRDAVSTNPQNKVAKLNFGELLLFGIPSRHKDEGERIFDGLINDFPDDFFVLKSYARMLAGRGKFGAAVEMLKKAINEEPNAKHYGEELKLYENEGQR